MDSKKKCRERMARLLVKREYSEAELYRKGIRWGYSSEIAHSALSRLRELNMVNDDRAASAHVESRLRNRPRGRVALKAELKKRGFVDGTISRALLRITDKTEEEAARKLAIKKVQSLRSYPPEIQHRRLAGFLSRRGFAGWVIADILADFRNVLEKEDYLDE